MGFELTDQQAQAFAREGFLLVPHLFDAEEMALLLAAAKAGRALEQASHAVPDGSGRKSRLTLWNHPGDDIFGMTARCHRIVDTAERLLGDQVYHYHSKVMMKQPRTGGAWEWHQDYGYWYHNGCLFPDMLSCMIALDPATRENGCLQVLAGSHRMGRIEHGSVGGQTGADPERVNAAMQRLDRVYCEMDSGDACFFHCNTLHRSDANTSDRPRWALICCYNTRRNDPYKDSHHPRYTPLDKVDDQMIKRLGLRDVGKDRVYYDGSDNPAAESNR